MQENSLATKIGHKNSRGKRSLLVGSSFGSASFVFLIVVVVFVLVLVVIPQPPKLYSAGLPFRQTHSALIVCNFYIVQYIS